MVEIVGFNKRDEGKVKGYLKVSKSWILLYLKEKNK